MLNHKPIETTIVELKAKVDSLQPFKEKLRSLGAEYVGTFRQIDTYFEVPQGRLKIRETEGKNEALLVYYERPDIQDIKQSQVFLTELPKPQFTKQFLKKALRTKTVVDKQRAIYRLEGTQIHLDEVQGLGTYVEFEKPAENTPEDTKKAHIDLEKLMRTLGLKADNLQKGSYSDLLLQQTTKRKAT
ncbi:MAG: class IV adenylate cyclase [Candidatus Bathyarchaeia archaeon]|nr:class IV adenylate cyclase [Candidatus Bathyarchaeota archaeon]